MKTKIEKGKVIAKPKAGEELIAVAPEEIQDHLEWGKALFQKGRHREALAEFEAVLRTAPGSIETRIMIRQAKDALAEPIIGGEAEDIEEVGTDECIWVKLGMITHRICTRKYDCLTCEFDQEMQERMAKEKTEDLATVIEKFKGLPGTQRICRHAIKGHISYRLCTRLFQCSKCEFGQNMDDAIERRLAKLAVRRESLRKHTA